MNILKDKIFALINLTNLTIGFTTFILLGMVVSCPATIRYHLLADLPEVEQALLVREVSEGQGTGEFFTLFSVFLQTYKAATKNPVESLRYE